MSEFYEFNPELAPAFFARERWLYDQIVALNNQYGVLCNETANINLQLNAKGSNIANDNSILLLRRVTSINQERIKILQDLQRYIPEFMRMKEHRESKVVAMEAIHAFIEGKPFTHNGKTYNYSLEEEARKRRY